jgi:V/A-type H+/Na+-transporting ATPase subunit I
MIVKMKKMLLFVSESKVDADLTLLGQLGAVHIIPFQQAKDDSIDRVFGRIEKMTRAISILEEFNSNPLPESERKVMAPEEHHGEVTLMEEVLKADEKRVQLKKQLDKLMGYKTWYNEWGNVDASDVKQLANAGIYLRFYQIGKKDFASIDKRNDIFLAGIKGNQYRLALITQDPEGKLPFDEIEAPKFRLCNLGKCLDEVNDDLEENYLLLQKYHTGIDLLKDSLEERNRRFGVRTVQFSGRSVDEKFSCWKGYLPAHSIDAFAELAEQNNWGYVLQEPTEEELDEVPTLISTPKWADTIKPVMGFMGLVPGYKEIDVSKVFMIFFTFFSGILVGDAGYGLVFLLITLLVHSKQKFKSRIEFSLMYTLSGSVMLWGILTGTYFGVKQIAEIPILSSLIIGKIASFGGDDVFLQKFMFIVGAIHLSIGHLQSAWKYSNSMKAISQIGWVAIVWGLFFFINQMVLLIPAPGFMLWLFIGGGILVALFSNPGKSFFKGIIASLADIPLNVISGFSDIISYIRLYAVGLATVLMAISFNEMAIGDGITTLVSGIVAIIILVLGHALNMVLAGMAVIVHGVRLNMLEYAGHAGVEFAGNEYNPFTLKKELENNN